MNYSDLVERIKEKKQALLVIVMVIALVLTTTFISSAVTASEKTDDYYDIKLGNKTVATVHSKADADKVIDGVMNYYAKDGAEVISTKCEPALTTEVHPVKKSEKTPKIENNTEKVVKHLVTGDVEEKNYEIKEGDTVWEVSVDLGVTFDEISKLNPNKDLEGLKPGDTIKYQKSEPMVNVISEVKVTDTEMIPYETEKVQDSNLYKDQSEVKEYGENGSKQVRAKLEVKNGEVINREVLESKVIKEAKTQVVAEGTKERPQANSSTNYGTGSGYNSGLSFYASTSGGSGSILSVARSYFGTSYSAMDCYAFCAAVYGQFGQSVMSGTVIPASQARPGDLLVFERHHYGICAGGNMVYHSIMGSGVCCTSTDYVRGYNGAVAYAVRKS